MARSPHDLKKGRPKPDNTLLTTLKTDITEQRLEHWPPHPEATGLSQVRDLPIYVGTPDSVADYYREWRPLYDRAHAFYPESAVGPEPEPLPSVLMLPLFANRVERLHLTRTAAKESRAFGAVTPLLHHCGAYTETQQQAMQDFLDGHADGTLVAHRLFIDLRAYVFAQDDKGVLQKPERMRYYRSGLVIAGLPDFEIIDSRQKPRKVRSDAYQNPLAQNEVWTIYGRLNTREATLNEQQEGSE